MLELIVFVVHNGRVPRARSRSHCPVHKDTELVCPRCIGSRGGKTTTRKHRKKLSRWGKSGGRPQTK